MTPERPPARAFNTVCDELGEPAALSKEFAKVGRRRWRPLLLAAWAMFAVSFFLPLSRMVWVDSGALHPDLMALVGSQRPYDLLWTLIKTGMMDVTLAVWVSVAVLLPNLPLPMTLPALLGSRKPARRWLPRVPATGCGPLRSRSRPRLSGSAAGAGPSADQRNRWPSTRVWACATPVCRPMPIED